MSKNLTLLAGPKAYRMIRDRGLAPDMVKVIAGAAGGPKWIVLNHLDRFLFSSWLAGRKEPLFLVGSSIATFRYAAVMQQDPIRAIETFLHDYIHQQYHGRPTPDEVSGKSLEILDAYLTDSGVNEVLNHPYLRFNAFVAKSRALTASENKYLLTGGLAGTALANLISRNGLKLFFERTLFYDPRTQPPFYGINDFPTKKIPITRENIKEVILASGSIPLVMSGVKDIQGTCGGIFRDGGVIDYHLDIHYGCDNTIVLYPHYTDTIIPGWLDKKLPWRKPSPNHVENILLVAPSKGFVRKLPHGKIPDRNDFVKFKGNDNERISYWKTVADTCRVLADDFHEAIETGTIKDLVKPI